jgi:hypothetical protein
LLAAVRTDIGKQQTPINFNTNKDELDLKEAKLPAIGWNLKASSTPEAPVTHDQTHTDAYKRITRVRTFVIK